MSGHTFVGFGFGPIQAGLFLYEAARSGKFARLVIGEVLPELVQAVREAEKSYALNIAHSDRIETASVGPIEIYDPSCESDRSALIEAVCQASEIATAIPSVRQYVSSGAESIHAILAEGLRRKASGSGPRAVVYAAENHNEAAEILQTAVLDEIRAAEQPAIAARVRFLNTVIGKMSRVVGDADEINELQLAPITPAYDRAFLVETFNRILISRIDFSEAGGSALSGQSPGRPSGVGRFERALTVFEEKDNLLPFEEAKLYGHNATHALIAYLGALRGIRRIAELRDHRDLFTLVRAAFLEESGEALIRRHAGADPMFTPEGYREFADDLLERMTNPFLLDTVERVGRDTGRKLGWHDRLVGTMRLALKAGIRPSRYGMGAAAALARLDPSFLRSDTPAASLLDPLWRHARPQPEERRAVLGLIEEGARQLRSQEL